MTKLKELLHGGVDTIKSFFVKDWERSKKLAVGIYKRIRRIPGDFKRFGLWARRKKRVYKTKHTKWKNKNQPFLKYWKDLFKIFPLYGVMIALMLWGVLNHTLTIKFIIGCALLAYFIKVELPYILRSIVHR